MGTLGATDYKQPKQVGIIQRARGNNRGGVHDIAPTLSVNSYVDNNVLAIKEATIKGYAELMSVTRLILANLTQKHVAVESVSKLLIH